MKQSQRASGTMTVVYAVEAWILSILGWGWLAAQESLGFSLLSSHVFLSIIVLSTCNLVLVGISPGSQAPRSAYFASVVVLSLYALSCVADSLFTPQLGHQPFHSPLRNVTCTLARTQQLFYFSSSQLFVLQAAGVLGYLIVQLVVAGAGMIDTEQQSLWPGPSWGLALLMLVCCRVFYMFDGSAKGVDDRSRYVQLFSTPIVEIATIAAAYMDIAAILLGLEGLVLPGLSWRKGVRYVSFIFSVGAVGTLLYVLLSKGMLTPALLGLLGIVIMVSMSSLIGAITARQDAGIRLEMRNPDSLPTAPAADAVYAAYQETLPSAPPASAVFGKYPPRPRESQPSAPPAQAVFGPGYMGDNLLSAKSRVVIPAPVEMLGLHVGKKKGV